MRRWKTTVLVLLMALAMAMPAAAQIATGRIEVTVVDATGAVLPGVVVDLTGPLNGTFTTGPDGAARFLNLPPGTYQVKAALAGFSDYNNPNIVVVAGGNVQLRATLAVGGVQQQVDVTAASPIIDAKKVGTSTNVTLDELQNIPSARDPWVVMQTVPGIIVDRVNVGGSESGQQSGYQAKGASGADATWNMDGIPITDMAATGATPTYYDFDMFQEMNVTTGGSDMSLATGGVGLNFILKSGTNKLRGSTRVYFENEDMQSNNMDPALATALGSPNGKGNRTNQYADYGFEVGFPIIRDKLWAWGSMGKTDVRILTIKQTPDRTILENRALKAQWQATNNVRASFTYFYGNKLKYGRDASATRPPETTYNQKGPSDFYKGEVNFVIGANLFLSARGSNFPTGFSFDPQGGMNKDVWQDDSAVWHGSYWNYYSDRPQQTLMGEGSYFRGKHEIKFGLSWRRVTVDSTSAVSSATGQKIVTYHIGYPDFWASVVSDWASKNRAFYTSAWVGDTVSFDRATVTAGLRFDWQNDGVLSVSEPAVPGFEQWLPAISGKDVPKAIKWNATSPRVGITYSLDESRKTQVRGSYALFASQLGNGSSGFVGVVQYRYAAFYGRDLNGDKIAQKNELDLSYLAGWSGFDPANPGKVDESINKIGDYAVPKTHEIIAGIDRELFKNFGVSASFTWRKFVDFNWDRRLGMNRSMYIQSGTLTGGPLPDGSNFSVPYYKADPAKVPAEALTGGRIREQRPEYYQKFWGIELQATKRLSDRWMARMGFSTNTHTEHFGDMSKSIVDPNPAPGAPLIEGGLVVRASGGSGKSGIYQLLPKYQINANGLYQGPWGLDFGANLVFRQGFGQAWNRSSVATGDMFGSSKTLALYTDINENRLPSVSSFDVRVGKQFKFKYTTWNIDFDVFNLFNAGTVLGRQYDYRRTGATGFNQTLEIMNPRIARVGLRVGF